LKNKTLISVITITAFITCAYCKYFYAYIIFSVAKWEAMTDMSRNIMVNIFQFSIILLACWFMFKKSPFKTLGLNTGFLQGFIWTIVFSLPMFIGYPMLSSFNTNLSLTIVYRDLIAAGFFEEYMFRGFLFGILFLYSGWGFIPATLIASLIFGSGHLYQATNFGEAISVFLFTAMASTGFALFYLAWKSLWIPIFLHASMDLAWDMFGLEGGAVGNATANIFRFTTIGLVVFFTVRKMKQNKSSLKGKLWIHKVV
jgi:CAAX protease family protein